MKLSPAMLAALRLIHARGGRARAFAIARSWGVDSPTHGVEWIQEKTIRALVDRGLLRVTSSIIKVVPGHRFPRTEDGTPILGHQRPEAVLLTDRGLGEIIRHEEEGHREPCGGCGAVEDGEANLCPRHPKEAARG